MADDWGGRGRGEGGRDHHMYICVWVGERARETEGGKASSQGGRWDEGEVRAQRLKNTGSPKSPFD